MKEILFSGSNDRPIGKNARRMMMHLSIPIDEDLQQTLSFFEKVSISPYLIWLSIFFLEIFLSCVLFTSCSPNNFTYMFI